MDFTKALQNANDTLKINIEAFEIVLVAHVLSPRGHDNLIQQNCSETEHFTVQEFNEIYQGVVDAGFFIKKIFFNEIEFIKDLIADPKEYSSTVVFNLCRNGTGMNKKSVLPAICDLLGIKYTSSDAGQCSLSRNKWLFTSCLDANGIKCPISGFEGKGLSGRLPDTAKVICKPNNESASQGIDSNSIVQLKEAISKYSGKILIQEYIDGYECEVPIFCTKDQCFAMPPVGISFSTNKITGILSYTDSLDSNYNFYALSDILSNNICETIMVDAERVFNILGLQRYGRVDFRIDKNTYQHYVIDIATTPYVTKHSSFAFAVAQCGGNYTDIFRLIFAAALNSNCK